MTMRKVLAGLLATLLWSTALSAQDWPSRQVTIVVPFIAGSTPDSLAQDRGGEPAAEALPAVRHREPAGRQRQYRHGGGGQGGAGWAHAGGEHRRAAGDQSSAVRQDALRDGEGHRADHDPRRAAERAHDRPECGGRQRREPDRCHQARARQVHLRLDRPRLAFASGHGVAGDEGGRDGGASAVCGIAGGGDGAVARRRADGGAAGRLRGAAGRAGEAEVAGRDLAAALAAAARPADAAGSGHRRRRSRRLGRPHRSRRHQRGGARQDSQGGGCRPSANRRWSRSSRLSSWCRSAIRPTRSGPC